MTVEPHWIPKNQMMEKETYASSAIGFTYLDITEKGLD